MLSGTKVWSLTRDGTFEVADLLGMQEQLASALLRMRERAGAAKTMRYASAAAAPLRVRSKRRLR